MHIILVFSGVSDIFRRFPAFSGEKVFSGLSSNRLFSVLRTVEREREIEREREKERERGNKVIMNKKY